MEPVGEHQANQAQHDDDAPPERNRAHQQQPSGPLRRLLDLSHPSPQRRAPLLGNSVPLERRIVDRHAEAGGVGRGDPAGVELEVLVGQLVPDR